MDEFAEEVLHHPEMIETFTQYKQTYEIARQVTIEDEFDIHLKAVKSRKGFSRVF